MNPFERLLKEVHARGLWAVLVVFAGGGWGVLGVIDTLIGYGYLPDWVFGAGLLLLLAGLPIVLATTWVQGGRRTRPTATSGDPQDEVRLAAAEGAVADRAPAGDASDASTRGLDPANLLTWPRTITGGVVAFAVLGLVALGYMGMRATGIGSPGTLVAQGVIDEGAAMVLADFGSTAGEAASGELITEALRIDLGQSETIRLLSAVAVSETLVRMRRSPEEPIEEGVALELAERMGAAGVITGEVGPVGSGFTINARVLSVGGDVLASFRSRADSEDELLDAIDELARDMRDKLGESLRSIATSPSLAAYTTTSVEALRRLTSASRGLARGTISAAVAQQMMAEAVALDSTFASGHVALAIAINNYGGNEETRARSWESAFRHRHRLPEDERLQVEAGYHSFTGRLNEAARAYQSMLALDPSNGAAAVNFADITMYRGNYDDAARALQAAPLTDSPAWMFNHYVALAGLNDLDGAMAVIDTFAAEVQDDGYHYGNRALLLTVFGRLDSASSVLDATPANSDPNALAFEEHARSVLSTVSGRVSEAREHRAAIDRIVEQFDAPSLRIHQRLFDPTLSLFVEGDSTTARSELDQMLIDVGWDELSPTNRAYPYVALHYALAGEVDAAEEMMAAFEAAGRPGADGFALDARAAARALIDVLGGDFAAADAFEAELSDRRCRRCSDLFLGVLYEKAGRTTEAAEAYERYVGTRFYDALGYHLQMLFPVIHERLAFIYDAEGQSARAAEHYRTFARLWSDADASLQPRVAHARSRAEALDPPA